MEPFTNLIENSDQKCVHHLLLSEIIDNIVNFLNEHVCLLIINIDDSSLKDKDEYIMKGDEGNKLIKFKYHLKYRLSIIR